MPSLPRLGRASQDRVANLIQRLANFSASTRFLHGGSNESVHRIIPKDLIIFTATIQGYAIEDRFLFTATADQTGQRRESSCFRKHCSVRRARTSNAEHIFVREGILLLNRFLPNRSSRQGTHVKSSPAIDAHTQSHRLLAIPSSHVSLDRLRRPSTFSRRSKHNHTLTSLT